MTYQSPLHIIKGIAGDDAFEINDDNLIRLRKRLLAELNLSGETTITVNKKSYSKDEIIKTIDQLLGNPDITLHDFIFRHVFLLRYLEDESMVLHPHTYSEFFVPKELQDKLNALLYERFILQFKKGVSTRAFTHAQQAITLMGYLTDDLKIMCYEEAHRTLHTLNTFLYELEHNITLNNKRDIQFLSFDSFANFLNALPEEFEEIKYDLVNRGINIVVGYHKLSRHDKDLVISISSMLKKIICEDDQAKLIINNHSIFTSGSSSSSSDYSYLRYIGIAAIILFNVFRVCNKSDSKDFSPGFDISSIKPLFSVPTARALNAGHELQLYQNEIRERAKVGNDLLESVLFDTLHNAGKNPFLYGFKFSNDSALKSWNKNLEVHNKSGWDLILFTHDFAKIAIEPVYIKQNESALIRFKDQNRFVFYFGNTLMRARKVNDYGAKIPGYYEHFRNPEHTGLFTTTYRLQLRQPKAKIQNDYTITVDSAFIENWADTIRFKKFSLIVTDQ